MSLQAVPAIEQSEKRTSFHSRDGKRGSAEPCGATNLTHTAKTGHRLAQFGEPSPEKSSSLDCYTFVATPCYHVIVPPTSPQLLCLLLTSLSALGIATSIRGQEALTAASVTEPGRDLDRALDIILGSPRRGLVPERSLFFLIDASPSLREVDFARKLTRALARNSKDLGKTEIGVGQVGLAKTVTLSLTSQHDLIPGKIKEMLVEPTVNIHNVYADIRKLVTTLKGKPGAHDIVLVTLENGEAEDDLEGTVKRLNGGQVRFTAIVRESFLADSYWTKRTRMWRDTKSVRPPRGCDMIGGDGPFIDFPWGWQFQWTVVNEVTPSGYAIYGINRLAAASQGRVFLLSPGDSGKHKCAIYGYCPFCRGNHVPSQEGYADGRLRDLAPLATSRTKAYSMVAVDPYFRALNLAWRDAAKAGLLRTTPSLKIQGTTSKPDRNRGGRDLGFRGSLSFERHARQAQKAVADCDRIISTLEEGMAKAAEQPATMARQEAMAALTRVYLEIARVNLIGFAAWCREIAPDRVDKKKATPKPPETPWFAPGETPTRVTFTTLCLCHGARAFLKLHMPGGKTFDDALIQLDDVINAFMKKFGHTPYAVAVHRAGIARFRLDTHGGPPRRKPSSSILDGPITLSGGKSGKNSGRGMPARAGGSSTGGTSTGPTTGK